jgi:hypothetical protein
MKEDICDSDLLFGATKTETNSQTWGKLTLPSDSFFLCVMLSLKLNPPNWSFPVRFSDQNVMNSLNLVQATCSTRFILFDLITLVILDEEGELSDPHHSSSSLLPSGPHTK